MELKLIRKFPSAECVIGELYVNGVFECFTLEDIERPVKVQNATAIPRGKYEVILNYSNRFKVQMPLLLNVAGFEGIRIHSGNTAADTEGCILVGTSKTANTILQSKIAYTKLFPKLQQAAAQEKIVIDLVN